MAQFTNYATLSYNGVTLTSNTVTGELLESVNISKTSTAVSYGIGDDLTYIVTLTNSSSAPMTNLTVTDDLGGYLYDGTTVYPLQYQSNSLRYFVNGVLQPTPTITAGPPLSVSGVNIPAGGNVELVYETLVTAYAPPAAGGTITNTASVTGARLITSVTATETLPAETGAELQITKSISPAAVSAGDLLTYTFLIENTGNTSVTEADNVVLSDTFDPILTDITVTYNGTPWTVTTNYTYDEATGVFSSVAGDMTVAAATYTQNADGIWTVVPGTATLNISGTVQP